MAPAPTRRSAPGGVRRFRSPGCCAVCYQHRGRQLTEGKPGPQKPPTASTGPRKRPPPQAAAHGQSARVTGGRRRLRPAEGGSVLTAGPKRAAPPPRPPTPEARPRHTGPGTDRRGVPGGWDTGRPPLLHSPLTLPLRAISLVPGRGPPPSALRPAARPVRSASPREHGGGSSRSAGRAAPPSGGRDRDKGRAAG